MGRACREGINLLSNLSLQGVKAEAPVVPPALRQRGEVGIQACSIKGVILMVLGPRGTLISV